MTRSQYDFMLSSAIYPDPASAHRNRGMWHVDLMAQSCDPDAIRDFLSPTNGDDDHGREEGSLSPPDLSVSRLTGPDLASIDDVMTRSWDPSLNKLVAARTAKPSG
jgi:hypothetical protein